MGGGAASMVTGPSLSGFSLFETICQRRSGIHMYIYVCVCKYIYILSPRHAHRANSNTSFLSFKIRLKVKDEGLQCLLTTDCENVDMSCVHCRCVHVLKVVAKLPNPFMVISVDFDRTSFWYVSAF